MLTAKMLVTNTPSTSRFRMRRPLQRAAAWLVVLAFAACTDAPRPVAPELSDVALARVPSAPNTILLTISGLPSGTPANVRITGPGGYSQTANASTQLTGLADGNYTVAASRVTVGTDAYDPTPASQNVNLRKGKTASLSVSFVRVSTTGSLALTITIPEATPAPVSVTGPNAYSQSVPSTQTLSNLAPGTYTISSPNFTAPSGVAYVSSTGSQTANVTAGATVARTVTYTATTVPPGGLNLQILGMYLTQSVQTLGSDVPLVTGRDGVLRVFAVANGTNTVQPSVRARLYSSGSLIATYAAAAPTSAVPTALNEASATASWNIPIPGSLVQPGLSILADVDPDATVAESSETDNTYPSSGTALAQSVQTVPTLPVKFVPVLQSNGSLLGNITETNSAPFLTPMRDMFPLQTVTSSVRSPYTTSVTLLSDGTGWGSVLSEVSALRQADGSSNHYYGVVKVTYGSGVAGIGYIGSPSSLGWDYMPSGGGVMAHEFGHNFGRRHAPCGGPSGVDPNYPYAGGIIGAYGYNVRTNTLIARTAPDLMTYCGPEWISDYTYEGVLSYRGSTTAPAFLGAADEPGLLVWGRVAATGEITLEPAVRVVAPAALPTRGGEYTIDATDAAGAPLVSLRFDPDETDDHAGVPERHFAFVIPMSEAAHARLQGLRVSGRGRAAERVSRLAASQLVSVADAVTADASMPGRARVRWNASAEGAAMVMVRDVRTGDVLSFARGGDVDLATPDAELELVVSDGVRSTTRRLRVRGR